MKKKMRGQRSKLSKVDVGILLITTFFVIAGGFWIHRMVFTKADLQPIVYTLRIDALPTEYGQDIWKGHLIAGADVWSENGTASMGSVIAVEERPHWKDVVQDGTIQPVSVPHCADLLVTVRAYASALEGDGFRVSEIRLLAGGTGSFRIGGYLVKRATVLSVKQENPS